MKKASLTTLVFIGWFALLICRSGSSSMASIAQTPPCNSTTNDFIDCVFKDQPDHSHGGDSGPNQRRNGKGLARQLTGRCAS